MKVDFRDVKARGDFRVVLEHYGLTLTAKGEEPVGRCPFHKETKPSFRINTAERNVSHCFGCGAKGNILDFVSRKEGVTIRRAAELVAKWCGLTASKRPVWGIPR